MIMGAEPTPRTKTLTKPHRLTGRCRSNSLACRNALKVFIIAAVCIFVGILTSYLYLDPLVSLHTAESFEGNATDKPGSIYTKLTSSVPSIPLWNSPSSEDNKSIDLQATNETIDEPNSAFYVSGGRPILNKVTILTGNPNSYYERAIRTHAVHNRIHGYAMYTLRESIMDDVWSKPAYILSVMLRELAKPVGERVEWLLWVDADTIILNPHVPAETFLPPGDWDDIHLLVSYDWNGLNNGVFPIRVCSWSIELLSAILAFPFYQPDTELVFRDQSAMADLLEQPKFASHTIKTPQRWFNAYQGEVNETLAPFQVRRGDLLVHFAGVQDRDQRMDHWLQRAEMHSDEWEIEFRYTSYATEAKDFWEDMRSERRLRKVEIQKQRAQTEDTLKFLTEAYDKFKAELEEDDVNAYREQKANLKKILDKTEHHQDVGALKQATDDARKHLGKLTDLWDNHLQKLRELAHSSIFNAEKVILSGYNFEDAATEMSAVKDAMKKLKSILLDGQSSPKVLVDATNDLKSRHGILRRKLNKIKQQHLDKEVTETSIKSKDTEDGSESNDPEMTATEE